MTAICVDDEYLLLRALRRAVEKSPDITATEVFDDEYDALKWAQTHPFDIAFLDIRMHEMDGMQLAEELKKIRPDAGIVFCTGYRDYAIKAMNMHQDFGYLLKPVDAALVQKEIDHVKNRQKKGLSGNNASVRKASDYLLTVRCYGGFEAYDRSGRMLSFRRSRSKELLALFVDRKGISMTARDICAIMFEDDGDFDRRNINYFYKLYYELQRVLKEAGADEVLLKNGSRYYLRPEQIRFDNTGKGSRGYLEEYPWAY